MTEFRLQFDPDDVPTIAARYSYEDDEQVLAIGRRARERGWYTRDELIAVCRWKSPRTQPLVAQNRDETVNAVTSRALSDSREEVRIRSLLDLSGVSWPTASVLLHFAHCDPYPILDYRALEALGVVRSGAYSMQFWLEYVDAARALAKSANVDMRTLDRALWQWSKERRNDGPAESSTEPVPKRGPDPRPLAPSTAASGEPDVVIIGCVSSKRRGPAKAKDLYTSTLFHKRRRYAELSGLPWVIFSAHHGILDPDDVIEWYDVALKKLPAETRRRKGAEAVAQLASRFDPLDGKVFEIHAGDAYVSALRAPLDDQGADLVNPLEGLGIGYQLQWYGR